MPAWVGLSFIVILAAVVIAAVIYAARHNRGAS